MDDPLVDPLFLPKLKDSEDRNFLLNICCTCEDPHNLTSFFERFLGWFELNRSLIPSFDMAKFLKETDKSGNSFLNLIVKNPNCKNDLTIVMEILEHINSYCITSLKSITNIKDNEGRNFLSNFCKISDPNLMTSQLSLLFEWFIKSDISFHYLLKSQNKLRHLFLDEILNNSLGNEILNEKCFREILLFLRRRARPVYDNLIRFIILFDRLKLKLMDCGLECYAETRSIPIMR